MKMADSFSFYTEVDSRSNLSECILYIKRIILRKNRRNFHVRSGEGLFSRRLLNIFDEF